MPMPTSGVIFAAKDLADAVLEEDEAVAVEEPEPEPEPPLALPEAAAEAVAVGELPAAVVDAEEASLVVALREPHCSAFLQFCWPSASLG